jgi:transposase InsO family protein
VGIVAHAPHIAAMDLFVFPTLGFKLLYVLVIIRLARRELAWINVTPHPTAEWIAQQITEAFPWNEAPLYLIRDRDAIYGAVVTRRLRALGIRDKPIAAGAPWQNCFAERLIGSIRRECVDHMVVLDEEHLRRVLNSYARYYNEMRTHRSLNKDAPDSATVCLVAAGYLFATKPPQLRLTSTEHLLAPAAPYENTRLYRVPAFGAADRLIAGEGCQTTSGTGLRIASP